VIQQRKLRQYGHVLKKTRMTVWNYMGYEVEGARSRGMPKKTWSEVAEKRLSDSTNMQGRCYGP